MGRDITKKRPQLLLGVELDLASRPVIGRRSERSRLVWSYLLSAVKVIEYGQVLLNKLSKHSL